MKKIIIILFIILIVLLVIYWGFPNLISEAEPPEKDVLEVTTSMMRYGIQELVVLELKNNSKQVIIFADNNYGMKLYQMREDGLWDEVVNIDGITSEIYSIMPGETAQITFNAEDLEEAKYKAVFEGWEINNYSVLIKGETSFQIYPQPTFLVELMGNSFDVDDRIGIVVTNDRIDTIVFEDNTLGLELFILNEAGEWMSLPSPLYNDGIEFKLEIGQNYQLQVPPLRGKGKYKITLKGFNENGDELVAELLLEIE